MKIKQGDVFACDCGLKVVVIEGCREGECDVTCCGRSMTPAQKKGSPEAWKQCCGQDPEAEVWKKFAKEKEKEE